MAKFFKRPGKKETLARKQEERVRRLNYLRSKFAGFSPQWWVGTGEIIGLVVVLAINFFLLFSFFGQEDQTNVFSAPLIPLLAKITSVFMPHSYGVRFWLLIFLLAFPLAFYFLIREISGRRLVAFIAVLIASLPIGIFLPLRVKLGLLTQDGGQVASLTLSMFVCLFLLSFLRRGNFKAGIASSLGVSLVALTSPLGLFVLFCFALAITFSEMLLGRARLKLARFLTVAVLSAGFSAFWYHPKFVFLIFNSSQGELLRETLGNLFPLSFFLVPLLGALGYLLFENRPHLQALFLAVFLSIGFGLLSLGAGVELSTPSRFLPSFGISLAFLGGLVLAKFFDYLKTAESFKRFKLLERYRELISFLSVCLFLSLFFLIINASGTSFRETQEAEVLGQAVVKRTGIWEIREETGGVANILGGGISFLTFGLTVFLGVKFRKKTG